MNNIIQTTILRNPVEIIPSIVTKTIGGIGNNITSGLPMPHEYNSINPNTLILEQFEVYKNYTYAIEKKYKKFKTFYF